MIKNITIDNLKEEEEEKNLYYMNKYMKYKSKYIELKNISNQNILNQKGGSYFYEQNDLIKRINSISTTKKFKKDLYQFGSIYFKTNLVNNDIIKKYGKIRKTMLKNNSPPPFNYHLTLLILEVNLDYPLISNSISYFDKTLGKKKIRKILSFLDPEEIKLNFETIFKNVVLKSVEYEVLGKMPKVKLEGGREIILGVKNEGQDDCIKYPGWYFVDKFDVNNKNLITMFRIKMYEKLNEFMKFEYIKLGGKTKDYVGYRVETEIDPDYILLFFDNFSKDVPLMAIKKFYYGKNTWMPHITIFKTDELVANNMKFLEKYVIDFLTNKNREQTNKMIFNELKKSSSIKTLMKKTNITKITIDDMEFELQV
jgi:hypothetical protein